MSTNDLIRVEQGSKGDIQNWPVNCCETKETRQEIVFFVDLSRPMRAQIIGLQHMHFLLQKQSETKSIQIG